MLQIVIGPVLFALGLVLIYAALHGIPNGLTFERALAPLRRPAAPRGLPPGDALVVEMLSEMLTLREQLAELRDQVGAIKGGSRRIPRAAR